jgi:hypothetical protein
MIYHRLLRFERKVVSKQDRALSAEGQTDTPALCIPGLGLLDEAAAMVLAQLIERRGIGARAEKADSLSIARFFSIDTSGFDVICLCYLEQASAAQIRYALRRVHRAAKDASIVVVLLREDENGARELPNTQITRGSFAAAVEVVLATAKERARPAPR